MSNAAGYDEPVGLLDYISMKQVMISTIFYSAKKRPFVMDKKNFYARECVTYVRRVLKTVLRIQVMRI